MMVGGFRGRILIGLLLILLIVNVNQSRNNNNGFWSYLFKPTSCQPELKALTISGPLGCEVDEEVTFRVTSEREAVRGIIVMTNDTSKVTDDNGTVIFTFKRPGIYKISAGDVGYNETFTHIIAYPKGNKMVPVRGLRFEPYNHIVPLHSMRLTGANFVYFKVWFVIDDELNISPAVLSSRYVVPCTLDELKKQAETIISLARSYSFKIFLVPFLWKINVTLDAPIEEKAKIFIIPSGYEAKFLDQLRQIVLSIAEFSERNHVEMLTPVCELHRYVGYELSSEWHQDILPKLRERYSGKLVIADQDYIADYFTRGKDVSDIPEFNYTGYDYVGLIYNPSGARSWNELEFAINKTLSYSDYLRQRYRVGVVISNIGSLGNADWMLREYPDNPGQARAEWFKMALQLSLGRVNGIFFNCWHYESITESVVDQLFVQGREPYDAIKGFLSVSWDGEEELNAAWGLLIKEKEDALWEHIIRKRIKDIVTDPYRDALSDALDLKSLRVLNDNKNLFIIVEFYSENATSQIILWLDINYDGKGDYIIRTFPSNEAVLFKVFAYDRHEYLCEINCTYNREITVKVPLKIIGNPEKVSFQIASWNEITKGVEDDFGCFHWLFWLVYDVTPQTFLPKPAEFTVTDLSISPKEVEVKQTITISVKVTNVGEQKGSYTIDLKVAGAIVDTKTVTLACGESIIVTLELGKEEVGAFDVEVSGLKGTFVVKETPPAWELYATITVVVIATIGVATVLYRRKRTAVA